MSKDEFIVKWGTEKLKSLNIFVEDIVPVPNSTVCFESDGLWTIIDYDDKLLRSLVMRGTEEDVFRRLDTLVRIASR